MMKTASESALAAAQDYILWRRAHGDRSEALDWREAAGREGTNKKSWRFKRRARARADGPVSLVLEVETDVWEEAMLAKWARACRLTPDGRLRIPDGAPAPWTYAQVRAAFDHQDMTDADVLAALIAADGEIEEDFMIRNRNIRLVIQELVDQGIDQKLDQKMDDRFGALLEEMRAARALKDPSCLAVGAEKRRRRG